LAFTGKKFTFAFSSSALALAPLALLTSLVCRREYGRWQTGHDVGLSHYWQSCCSTDNK